MVITAQRLQEEYGSYLEPTSVLELGALCQEKRTSNKIIGQGDDKHLRLNYREDLVRVLEPVKSSWVGSEKDFSAIDHPEQLQEIGLNNMRDIPSTFIQGPYIAMVSQQEWKLDDHVLQLLSRIQSESKYQLTLGIPYSNQIHYNDLFETLSQLQNYSDVLASLTWLPASVGDRIILPEATTHGFLDMALPGITGLIIPDIPVRVSWGTLGWKIGQIALAFNCQILEGWGVLEQLFYGDRSRPASVVLEQEFRQGVQEAGFSL